jgi:hypothetical protein
VNPRGLRILWAIALGLAFTLSIHAVVRGGYIGPDYPTHLSRLIQWPKVFDFAATNPPIYYLLGHGLFVLIGPTNSFPITLSILQVAINLVALWYFFQYTQPRFGSALIHSALCLFLIFLPVRLIHAATLGADSMTVPLFVLLLFVLNKVLLDETSPLRNAALLGLALGAGVWVKYSFMVLIPTLLVLFFFLWTRRRWKFERFLAICILSLALPFALSIYSFWASTQAHGYNTEKHWLQKGVPPDMTSFCEGKRPSTFSGARVLQARDSPAPPAQLSRLVARGCFHRSHESVPRPVRPAKYRAHPDPGSENAAPLEDAGDASVNVSRLNLDSVSVGRDRVAFVLCAQRTCQRQARARTRYSAARHRLLSAHVSADSFCSRWRSLRILDAAAHLAWPALVFPGGISLYRQENTAEVRENRSGRFAPGWHSMRNRRCHAHLSETGRLPAITLQNMRVSAGRFRSDASQKAVASELMTIEIATNPINR